MVRSNKESKTLLYAMYKKKKNSSNYKYTDRLKVK